MLISPLRYPGGKLKLARFLGQVMQSNNALDSLYVEPFAGGAGAALWLLSMEHARRIWINDLDPAIYSFWISTVEHTDELCALIDAAKLTVAEWRLQREIYQQADQSDRLSLGFAAFYLNRTNRSGILRGSVIGGQNQTGKWLMDARFSKEALISRIKDIANYKNRIIVTNVDAIDLLDRVKNINKEVFVYLDPPYYNNANRLYLNHYNNEDHKTLANAVRRFPGNWIVTYDNCDEIRNLYDDLKITNFVLKYSAAAAREGSEIIISKNNVVLPYDQIPGMV